MQSPAGVCQPSTSRSCVSMTKDDGTMSPFQQVVLEDVGAPAQVRAHRHDFAVMQAALDTARVALEQKSKSLPLHDLEDALGLNLQPGEVIEVKPVNGIIATLNSGARGGGRRNVLAKYRPKPLKWFAASRIVR
jgi:hypothetical protein